MHASLKDKFHYVYRHIRADKNEVFYIGIGTYTKKHKYQRAYDKILRSKHWHNIFKKTQVLVEIIFEDYDESLVKNKEKEFIKIYGRKDISGGSLINLTDGGDGGTNYKHTQEQLNKMSLIKRGVKNHFYGRTHSSDTKKIMRERHVNCSGENNNFYGKKHSDKTKQKLKEINTGRQNSEESKKKVSATLKKIRPCAKKILDTHTGLIYPCLKDVTAEIGCNYYTLAGKLNGRSPNNTKYIYL